MIDQLDMILTLCLSEERYVAKKLVRKVSGEDAGTVHDNMVQHCVERL